MAELYEEVSEHGRSSLEEHRSESDTTPSRSNSLQRRKPSTGTSVGSVREFDLSTDQFAMYLDTTRSSGTRQLCTEPRAYSVPRLTSLEAEDTMTSSPLSTDSSSGELELLETAEGRREWTKRQVHGRRKEYLKSQKVSLFSGTWNVCGSKPTKDLSDWLFCDGIEYDVYALSLQEVQPLSGMSAMATDPSRGKYWTSHFEKTLRAQGDYICICSRQMVGILLMVFVRAEHEPFTRDVMMTEAGTGFMNKGGNKGAVAMRFQLYESTFCIVACHLAAQQDNVARRNQDYKEIVRKVTFTEEFYFSSLSSLLYSGKSHKIMNHDLIIWLGDLNYRIDLDSGVVLEAIGREDWTMLLEYDQLRRAREKDPGLFQHFKEAKLNFAPTYKTNKKLDGYVMGDNGKPSRPPAWTDRVLWRTDAKGFDTLMDDEDCIPCFRVSCDDYRRHEIMSSDHRPVSAIFRIQAMRLDGKNRSRVLSDVYTKLLPALSVNPGHGWLPQLRYKSVAEETFVVENNGKVPLEYEITDIPPWLQVTPTRSRLSSSKSERIQMRARVDRAEDLKLKAALGSSGSCGTGQLCAALKIVVTHGPILELPIYASYLCSILGCSLDEMLEKTPAAKPVGVPLPVVLLCDALARSTGPAFEGEACKVRVGHIIGLASKLEIIPDNESGDVISESILELLSCLDKPLVPADITDALVRVGENGPDSSVIETFEKLEKSGHAVLRCIVSSIRKAHLSNENTAFKSIALVAFELGKEDEGFSSEHDLPTLVHCLGVLARVSASEEVTQCATQTTDDALTPRDSTDSLEDASPEGDTAPKVEASIVAIDGLTAGACPQQGKVENNFGEPNIDDHKATGARIPLEEDVVTEDEINMPILSSEPYTTHGEAQQLNAFDTIDEAPSSAKESQAFEVVGDLSMGGHAVEREVIGTVEDTVQSEATVKSSAPEVAEEGVTKVVDCTHEDNIVSDELLCSTELSPTEQSILERTLSEVPADNLP